MKERVASRALVGEDNIGERESIKTEMATKRISWFPNFFLSAKSWWKLNYLSSSTSI